MMSLPPRSLKITDINPHLMCVLCGGYYVDATTIIECLHSFCKSCIVRYLETNKYCPICDVQVHKTKPLLNIRSDRTLQTIVYKLVPGLLQRELQCRKEFYKKYPENKAVNNESSGEISHDFPIYLPEESILLGVQYAEPSALKGPDKRYLKCPAAITICHLQKLMRAKFNLNASQKVEFLHDGDLLPDYLSLMDLAYMYHWKRKHTVELEYRLLECQQKKIKLFHEDDKSVFEKNKQNIGESVNPVNISGEVTEQTDREVHLQISENGVMSVQSIDCKNVVNNTIISSKLDDNRLPDNSLPMKDIQPETIELMKSLEKTVQINFEKSLNKSDEINNLCPTNQIKETPTVNIGEVESTSKIIPNNASLGEKKEEKSDTENQCKLENHSTASLVLHTPPTSTDSTTSVPKVYPGAIKEDPNTLKLLRVKEQKADIKEHELNLKPVPEKYEYAKVSNNIRYKTLKSPTKPWNPTIPRSALMAMKQAQSSNQEKGAETSGKSVQKAPKFFKMRNVPRFLGNPASGVKPMYQVLPGSELSNQTVQTSSPAQNSKHNSDISVMKIDPKTLNPIPASRSSRPSKLTSPPSKLSSTFACSPQKPSDSHMISCRTTICNPLSKNINMLKTPNQAHNTSLTSNPFILPSPHPTHMMYSGFPRQFSSVDSSTSRLPSDNQIFRAMSMLCSQSAAFHPSLPPSISMLFNPHHPQHRSSQNEKLNMKNYAASDFNKAASTTTPSVQRVPPSGHITKHSSATSVTANDTNNSASKSHNHTSTKHTEKQQFNENDLNTREIKGSIPSNSSAETQKNNESSTINSSKNVLSNSVEVKSSVPLSNGYSVTSKGPVVSGSIFPSYKNKINLEDKTCLKSTNVEQMSSEAKNCDKVNEKK